MLPSPAIDKEEKIVRLSARLHTVDIIKSKDKINKIKDKIQDSWAGFF